MTSQLARRIAVTLGLLFVYRLGTYVPLPGVDVAVWMEILKSQPNGVLAQADQLSGGAVGRLSIFSISIVPYVTSAIFVQLALMVSRRLKAIRDQGERGRQRIEQTTRVATAILAAFQAYGVAGGLEGLSSVVAAPGPLFVPTITLTLTAGVLFQVWLSRQITVHGIGNGLALFLFAGVATQLPYDIVATVELARIGTISPRAELGFFVIAVAVTALIVAMERAQLQLKVRFAARQAGDRALPEQSVHLVYRLNQAGIMPISIAALFPTILVLMISVAAAVVGYDRIVPQTGSLIEAISPGTSTHLAVTVVLTLLFVFIYTAFVCDPADAAEKLKARRGVIDDVAAGEPTANYLDGVLTRTAVIGAIYLGVVTILVPEILRMIVPFAPLYVDGISLLILVCVTLDIEAQVRGLMARQA